MDQWTLAKLSNKTGEIYQSSYLDNAISYINSNRQNHGLENSKELIDIITQFVISEDEAYKS